jgi:hypothetical protein
MSTGGTFEKDAKADADAQAKAERTASMKVSVLDLLIKVLGLIADPCNTNAETQRLIVIARLIVREHQHWTVAAMTPPPGPLVRYNTTMELLFRAEDMTLPEVLDALELVLNQTDVQSQSQVARTALLGLPQFDPTRVMGKPWDQESTEVEHRIIAWRRDLIKMHTREAHEMSVTRM